MPKFPVDVGTSLKQQIFLLVKEDFIESVTLKRLFSPYLDMSKCQELSIRWSCDKPQTCPRCASYLTSSSLQGINNENIYIALLCLLQWIPLFSCQISSSFFPFFFNNHIMINTQLSKMKLLCSIVGIFRTLCSVCPCKKLGARKCDEINL